MKQIILLVTLTTIAFSGFSQGYNPNLPPNTYRSSENPLYWKNKMPHPGYWQQDVHYRMDVRVDDQRNTVSGNEKITYWNNSPDTLTEIYFHLYQNAFQPGSYYDMLHQSNKTWTYYGYYERNRKGTEITKFNINGVAVSFNVDNTILRAKLLQPLPPNSSIEFDIDFTTYFDQGSVRRRMKVFSAYGNKHYDGVHWYPRISVYDRKFGWTTDQHLGREFYGDFGTFDVKINFPGHYIVGATGTLQNKNEIFTEEQWQQLDLKNFANKPFGEAPSQIIPIDTAVRNTWHFYAENVHDFGWTADPTYRIGEVMLNGVLCQALAQEPHASGWQKAAEYASKIIEVFSRDFGMYEWPKIIVADARDGMEYNMMTLDGGTDPGHRSLLVHEVAHMWFYGMLGSNETYRASMDEGFTQFATGWGLTQIEGERPGYEKRKWAGKNYEPQTFRFQRNYGPYLYDAIRNEDPALNTHSDDFDGKLRHGGGYRHVYFKMGTMLYNLKYVLGDDLFWAAMQNYVAQWKMAHPYFEDFKASMIRYTGVDLNWFFDQWWDTNKNIDFAITKVKNGPAENQYHITFKRKGQMQMPIDFTVFTRDGKAHNFHIPNTDFVKKTDATVLPKWLGWGVLNNEYTATINVPGRVRNVQIDTTLTLADVNLLNNSYRTPINFGLEKPYNEGISWEAYDLNWRPDVWYNAVDGIKAGLHFNGEYMDYLHNFRFTTWYNTGLFANEDIRNEDAQDVRRLPVSFIGNYRTALRGIDPKLQFFIEGRVLDGLNSGEAGFIKSFSDNNTTTISYKFMVRPQDEDLDYLLYPAQWIAGQYNNSVNINHRATYNTVRGGGSVNFFVRSASFGSHYSYSTASAEWKHLYQARKFDWRNRFVISHTGGSNIAPESQLYFAGANPEEMMDNKFARARGIVPGDWAGYGITTNHFHHAGGLNMRGYANYLAPEEDENGNIYFLYKGNTGAAFNAELDFKRLFRWRPQFFRNWLSINPYLFGDAGIMAYSDNLGDFQLPMPRFDAGIGAAVNITNWFGIQKASPLTLRFDVPFYISHAPFEENNVQFRWVAGFNRAF